MEQILWPISRCQNPFRAARIMRSTGTGSHGILHRAKIGRCLNAILINMRLTIWRDYVPMPYSKGCIAPTVPEAWTIYEDPAVLDFPCGRVQCAYRMFRAISPLGDTLNWPKQVRIKKEGLSALFTGLKYSSSSLYRSINFLPAA